MKTACFANINDPANIGDFASCPLNYFNFPYESKHVHFLKKIPRADIFIIGGGGLLYFKPKVWKNLRARADIHIGWGIGSNNDGSEEQTNEFEAKAGFKLWGRRMWNHDSSNEEWVPCVSCMSDLFLRNYRIQREYVCIEHTTVPMNLNVPTITNDMSLEQTLSFIGSGNTVITNSYHIAYWATLLNRRVVVVAPTSSKFETLKHLPQIVGQFEFGIERKARIYPEALTECRLANVKFYYKVLEATK